MHDNRQADYRAKPVWRGLTTLALACLLGATSGQIGQAELQFQSVLRTLSGSYAGSFTTCPILGTSQEFNQFPGKFTERHSYLGCRTIPYASVTQTSVIGDSSIELTGDLRAFEGAASSKLISDFTLSEPAFYRMEMALTGQTVRAGSAAPTTGEFQLSRDGQVLVSATRPFKPDFIPIVFPPYRYGTAGTLSPGSYSLSMGSSGGGDNASGTFEFSFRVLNDLPSIPVRLSPVGTSGMSMSFGPGKVEPLANFLFEGSEAIEGTMGICQPSSDAGCLTQLGSLDLKSDRLNQFEARLDEFRLASAEPLVVKSATGADRLYRVVATGKPQGWDDPRGGVIELVAGENGVGAVKSLELVTDWIYEFIPEGGRLGDASNPQFPHRSTLKLVPTPAAVPAQALLKPGSQTPNGLLLGWNGTEYQSLRLSDGVVSFSIVVPEPSSGAMLMLGLLMLTTRRRAM